MQDMGIEGLNWNHGDLRNERWGELGQFSELMSWGQFLEWMPSCKSMSPSGLCFQISSRVSWSD